MAGVNKSAGLPEKVPGRGAVDISDPATAQANLDAALPNLETEQWKKFRHAIAGVKLNGGTETDALYALARGAGVDKELTGIIATRLEGKLEELVKFTGHGVTNRGLAAGVLDATKFRSLPLLRKTRDAAGSLAPPFGMLADPEDDAGAVDPLTQEDVRLVDALVKAHAEQDPAVKTRLMQEIRTLSETYQPIGLGLAGNPLSMMMGLFEDDPEPAEDTMARTAAEGGAEVDPRTAVDRGDHTGFMQPPSVFLEHQADVEEQEHAAEYDGDVPLAESGARFQADRVEDQELFWNTLLKKYPKPTREQAVKFGREMIKDPRLLMEFLNFTETGEPRQSQPFTEQEIRAILSSQEL